MANDTGTLPVASGQAPGDDAHQVWGPATEERLLVEASGLAVLPAKQSSDRLRSGRRKFWVRIKHPRCNLLRVYEDGYPFWDIAAVLRSTMAFLS